MKPRMLAERADWMRFPEAAYSESTSEADWTAELLESFKAILTRAAEVGFQVLEHEDFSFVGHRYQVATAAPARWQEGTPEAWLRGEINPFLRAVFYPPWSVGTHRELEPHLGPEGSDVMRRFRAHIGIDDCLGIVTHPLPNVVVVVWAFSDSLIELSRYERRLLTQIALHVEAGYRLRRRPEIVKAELRSDGRVVDRRADAPSTEVLEAQAARVLEARSRSHRSSADALDLWTALVAGRVTLAPRGRGSRRSYAVLDNPLESHPFHALSEGERDVLALAARGHSTKMVAYGLGISPATVSTRLASTASKLGLASRTELVRIAAMLSRDPRATLPDAELTASERDVLELLHRGLSNREIARLRSRSVRTIANQVASLLRKTGSDSRRALVARTIAADSNAAAST